WRALAKVGAAIETPLTLAAADAPLDDVLNRLCDQLNDALDSFDPARITVDRGRVVLTSDSLARRRVVTAVYDLHKIIALHRRTVLYERDQPSDDEIAEIWLNILMESIDPDGWRNLGGGT